MISLIEITNSENHISETYRLLKLRTSSISHKKKPTFEEHKNFVINHPYRFWFLVKSSKEYIGSVYLKHDNSIGLNIIDGFSNLTKEVLQKVAQIKKIIRLLRFWLKYLLTLFKYINQHLEKRKLLTISFLQ